MAGEGRDRVKRLLLIGTVVDGFAIGFQTHAQPLYSFGMGMNSCGDWLSTPDNTYAGEM